MLEFFYGVWSWAPWGSPGPPFLGIFCVSFELYSMFVLTLCLLGSSGAHFFIDFYKTSTKNNPITLSFAAVLQYFFAFLRQLLLDSKCFFASFCSRLHLTAVLQYYLLFPWAFSASHSSFIVCLCSPGLSLALLGLIFYRFFAVWNIYMRER